MHKKEQVNNMIKLRNVGPKNRKSGGPEGLRPKGGGSKGGAQRSGTPQRGDSKGSGPKTGGKNLALFFSSPEGMWCHGCQALIPVPVTPWALIRVGRELSSALAVTLAGSSTDRGDL